MKDLARQAGFRMDVLDDFGHLLRPWVVSAGQGDRGCSAEMRIGLLATLGMKLMLFPRFSGCLKPRDRLQGKSPLL